MRLLYEDRVEERAVAVMDLRTQTGDTARAFDGVAGEYHDTNMANPILLEMRTRALATLRRHVAAGAEVLDIGCGPGTDHPALLDAGYVVTAIDASPEMVRQAQRRAAAVGGPHRPTVLCRPVNELRSFAPRQFDAAFSNFGPLNCSPAPFDAACQIHDVLRPGGLLVASVIGRFCPWEVALYLARGQAGRAFLRFRRGPVGVPLKDGTVWTRYISPGACARIFTAAGFSVRHVRALGITAPPPYLEAFALRRPALVRRLFALDDVIGTWPVVRAAGDHFLIVLQRD